MNVSAPSASSSPTIGASATIQRGSSSMWSNKPFTTMRSNAATPKPVTAPTSPAIDDDLRRLLDDSARSVSTSLMGCPSRGPRLIGQLARRVAERLEPFDHRGAKCGRHVADDLGDLSPPRGRDLVEQRLTGSAQLHLDLAPALRRGSAVHETRLHQPIAHPRRRRGMHAELFGQVGDPLRASRCEGDERPVLGQRDRVAGLGDRPGRHRHQRPRGSKHRVHQLSGLMHHASVAHCTEPQPTVPR